MLFSILIAVMVVLGIVLVVLILLQQGKGADAGAAFGSGASGTVFGARGSGSFLSRATGVLMAVFMILALVMAWLGQHGVVKSSSVMAAPAPASVSAPAVPHGVPGVAAPAPPAISAGQAGTALRAAAPATSPPAATGL